LTEKEEKRAIIDRKREEKELKDCPKRGEKELKDCPKRREEPLLTERGERAIIDGKRRTGIPT